MSSGLEALRLPHQRGGELMQKSSWDLSLVPTKEALRAHEVKQADMQCPSSGLEKEAKMLDGQLA